MFALWNVKLCVHKTFLVKLISLLTRMNLKRHGNSFLNVWRHQSHNKWYGNSFDSEKNITIQILTIGILTTIHSTLPKKGGKVVNAFQNSSKIYMIVYMLNIQYITV